LCGCSDSGKLAADSELSVKNGAELLDRLIKDIVSESAATYISMVDTTEKPRDANADPDRAPSETSSSHPTAFSLAKFIPLLQERIHVLNPFTRTFLVSWVTLLDTIPDLELVSYLPAFLGGLFKFLSDSNRDVHVATQGCLERFLMEIKRIAKVKEGIEESRRSGSVLKSRRGDSTGSGSMRSDGSMNEKSDVGDDGLDDEDEDDQHTSDDDWIPGQDVEVDHPKILEILVNFLDPSSGA
jgi:vacuole morphology and inheritance protein 14